MARDLCTIIYERFRMLDISDVRRALRKKCSYTTAVEVSRYVGIKVLESSR